MRSLVTCQLDAPCAGGLWRRHHQRARGFGRCGYAFQMVNPPLANFTHKMLCGRGACGQVAEWLRAANCTPGDVGSIPALASHRLLAALFWGGHFHLNRKCPAESNRFCAVNILTMEFHCNSIVDRHGKRRGEFANLHHASSRSH
jgi:hypothetical protein